MSLLAITPALSSTLSEISTVEDQVANLMRWAVMNPGWTSSLWEEELISFRVLIAKYEQDKDELTKQFRSAFNRALTNMFPDHVFELTFVSTFDEEGVNAGGYSLTFDIFIVQAGSDMTSPALVAGTIYIGSDGKTIELNFTESNNTLVTGG